jgi:phospholipid/cholesterol/gamma-HCH transport system substrate-binding protein
VTDVFKDGLVRRLAVLLVLGLLVVAVTTLIRGGERTINVTFTSAEGLYVGDDVRVLGVPVGTISEITPLETGVEVELTIEDDQPIPADARAAIVSPSLVSGRFVQLVPRSASTAPRFQSPSTTSSSS